MPVIAAKVADFAETCVGVIMVNDVVLSLVKSKEADVREMALKRLMRRSTLAEEDRQLLEDAIPSLSYECFIELLHHHGDIGCPAKFVERLVAWMPLPEDAAQFPYVDSFVNLAASRLDTDAYADLVARLQPVASDLVYSILFGRVRGCPLFNSILKHEEQRPPWTRFGFAKSLAEGLFDIRNDELGIPKRLKERLAEAPLDELLRLWWVTGAVGQADLASAAWDRSLDEFAFPWPVRKDEHEQRVHEDHFQIVIEWAGQSSPDRAQRISWLADRVVELESNGANFSSLLNHSRNVPEGLLLDVARVLVDRGVPPSWAAPVLHERLVNGSLGAWDSVFKWWPEDGSRHSRFDSYAERKAILMNAPLPHDPPEDFDEAFLCRAEALLRHERWQIKCRRAMFDGRPLSTDLEHDELDEDDLEFGLNPSLGEAAAGFRPLVTRPRIVDRLLQMGLTPARARRIAPMIKGSRELIRDARMVGVATLSGPIAPNMAPMLEEISVHSPEQLDLYRKLGGAAADAQLLDQVRANFAELAKNGDDYRPVAGGLLWWWKPLHELLDDDLRAEMGRWASSLPFRRMQDLHRQAPWLVDSATVDAAAQRHIAAGLQWDDFDLPPRLRPFIEARARQTTNDDELATALTWLENHGCARSERLEIVLEQLARRTPEPRLVRVAAKMLTSRAAWEIDGVILVRSLARWNAWPAVGQVWWALSELCGNNPEVDRNKLVTAAHLAFANVIVELAAHAGDAGDEHRTVALLTALLKLDPPPPVIRSLAKLKRHGMSERARDRIDMGMKLFKSTEGRTPTIGSLYEATQTLHTYQMANAAPKSE